MAPSRCLLLWIDEQENRLVGLHPECALDACVMQSREVVKEDQFHCLTPSLKDHSFGTTRLMIATNL